MSVIVTVTVAVTAILDISVVKTSDKLDYEEGETVTYTVTVTNNGPSSATNIVVGDIVPGDIAYDIGSMLGGDTRVATDPYGSGLRWTINALTSLPPMNTVDLTFTGKVAAGANLNTPVTNTANYINIKLTCLS